MNARVICESGVRNCQLICPWCARLVSLARRRESWQVYNQIMYNEKVKVPWLIRTKHFPESKNTCQNRNVFWILGIILLLFLFWTLRNVSDSGTCFGFWEVFCPYETSAYAMRTSVINSQIFLILRLICHDQRIYEQIIFCKTGLSIKDNCIFLHK